MKRTFQNYLMLYLFLLSMVGGVIYALLGVEKQRDAADDSVNRGSLTGILIGMEQYQDKYGYLPPAAWIDADGNRHSWRVLLLEFIDPQLYSQYSFREPWDGPHNSRLLPSIPSVYRTRTKSSRDPSRTNFVVVTGKGTAFPPDQTVKTSDISDGLATTLLVVESVSTDILWMEPRDLDLVSMSFAINDRARASISTFRSTAPLGLYANRDRTSIPTDLTERDLRALLSIAGSEKIDPDSRKRLD